MRSSGQSRHNGRRRHLVRLKAGEEAGRFAVVLFLQDVIDRIGRMAWMAHREVACIPAYKIDRCVGKRTDTAHP